MTKWVDQKCVEMRIAVCDAWQKVLDELERPDGRYTPRHATSILKGIAKKYSEHSTSCPGEQNHLSSPLSLKNLSSSQLP